MGKLWSSGENHHNAFFSQTEAPQASIDLHSLSQALSNQFVLAPSHLFLICLTAPRIKLTTCLLKFSEAMFPAALSESWGGEMYCFASPQEALWYLNRKGLAQIDLYMPTFTLNELESCRSNLVDYQVLFVHM